MSIYSHDIRIINAQMHTNDNVAGECWCAAADGPGLGAVRDVRQQRAGPRHGGGRARHVLLRPQVTN